MGQTSVADLEISYWCTLLRQTGKVRQRPGQGPWSLGVGWPLSPALCCPLHQPSGGQNMVLVSRGHCAESPPWGWNQPSQGAPSMGKE